MLTQVDIFPHAWSENFRLVHNGNNLISRFQVSQLGRFHPGHEITLDQRISRQEVWINHIAGLEEIDQNFFMPYWVPIQEDLCQWYVDLSDPALPVFSAYYFEEEPRCWFKNVISPSLTELILDLENGADFEILLKKEHHGTLDIIYRELKIRKLLD